MLEKQALLDRVIKLRNDLRRASEAISAHLVIKGNAETCAYEKFADSLAVIKSRIAASQQGLDQIDRTIEQVTVNNPACTTWCNQIFCVHSKRQSAILHAWQVAIYHPRSPVFHSKGTLCLHIIYGEDAQSLYIHS